MYDVAEAEKTSVWWSGVTLRKIHEASGHFLFPEI